MKVPKSEAHNVAKNAIINSHAATPGGSGSAAMIKDEGQPTPGSQSNAPTPGNPSTPMTPSVVKQEAKDDEDKFQAEVNGQLQEAGLGRFTFRNTHINTLEQF